MLAPAIHCNRVLSACSVNDLFECFRTGTPVLADGREYRLQAIEREDGSGRSFNLQADLISPLLTVEQRRFCHRRIYWRFQNVNCGTMNVVHVSTPDCVPAPARESLYRIG